MNKELIRKAIDKTLADKGKKKFTQSVELIFNFRGVDFSKPENRLNLGIALPKGRGKNELVAVFADQQVALDAKNAGADLIMGSSDIEKLGKDKKKLKQVAAKYIFLAQPNLMVLVGKNLGQVLGSRGKLPKPIVGSGATAQMIENIKRTVKISTKGKYLPVAQCAIGTEIMKNDDLLENAMAVFDKVSEKVGIHSLKGMYVKLTMGKAIKV